MINWRLEMSLEDVDLEAGILSDLQKLAAKFHLKELIIFGSRADGTASDVSDVDLAVKGYGSPMVRADFEEAVKNLPVLLMFDIVDYDSILVSDVLRKEIDEKVLLPKLKKSLQTGEPAKVTVDVTNINRTFGTILGSEITKKFSDTLEEDTITVECHGSGGQSFGAFIPKGLKLELVGDSNDYLGKGLSGGKIVVYPQAGSKFKAEDNIIIGNVALYGATSGKAFINGIAGERFCVRNSGATAVVEGVGDHGCEYMTGGRVVILGPTGKNFAAGMSGGVAYVLDENSDLYLKLNKDLVSSQPVTDKYDVLELKKIIEEHVEATNSAKGKNILENFSDYLPKFKKIISYDYSKMLQLIAQMEERGLSYEQAQIEAFYAHKNQA